jgi:hypothetical protein
MAAGMEFDLYFKTLLIGIPVLVLFWILSARYLSRIVMRRMLRAFFISLIITPFPLVTGHAGALIPAIVGLWWSVRMAFDVSDPMHHSALLSGFICFLLPAIVVALMIFGGLSVCSAVWGKNKKA